MSSRERLIPTPVVDKNGKTTTVYRRDSALGGITNLLPAPSLSSPQAREELILAAEKSLLTGNFIDKAFKLAVRRNLHQYSDELLEKIKTLVDSDETHKKDAYGYAPKLRSKFVDEGDSEESFREAIMFYPLLTHRGAAVTSNLIDSLHYYDQLPESDDYSSESPEVIAQCAALIQVTDSLLGIDGALERMRIKDDRLVDLIISDPERAPEIAAIIEDRGSADFEVIRDMLSSSAPAINDGIL